MEQAMQHRNLFAFNDLAGVHLCTHLVYTGTDKLGATPNTCQDFGWADDDVNMIHLCHDLVGVAYLPPTYVWDPTKQFPCTSRYCTSLRLSLEKKGEGGSSKKFRTVLTKTPRIGNNAIAVQSSWGAERWRPVSMVLTAPIL